MQYLRFDKPLMQLLIQFREVFRQTFCHLLHDQGVSSASRHTADWDAKQHAAHSSISMITYMQTATQLCWAGKALTGCGGEHKTVQFVVQKGKCRSRTAVLLYPKQDLALSKSSLTAPQKS